MSNALGAEKAAHSACRRQVNRRFEDCREPKLDEKQLFEKEMRKGSAFRLQNEQLGRTRPGWDGVDKKSHALWKRQRTRAHERIVTLLYHNGAAERGTKDHMAKQKWLKRGGKCYGGGGCGRECGVN
eukprot:6212206-Pleurochrysis_carterae.AAC.4